jgi:hypothetical protein
MVHFLCCKETREIFRPFNKISNIYFLQYVKKIWINVLFCFIQALSGTAVHSLVQGLPEALQRQYEYEDPIARSGKHLMHSPFSHNFRFSMSLSLSPNSLYRQTTDCTEGGGLTREHCNCFNTMFYLLNKTFVARDIKVIINTWQQQFIFICGVIGRSHLIVKLSAICCCVNFGFSFWQVIMEYQNWSSNTVIDLIVEGRNRWSVALIRIITCIYFSSDYICTFNPEQNL